MLKSRLLSLFLAVVTVFAADAQSPIRIHSHNDYCRQMPFYQAYAQRIYSIEADVFLQDSILYVGHEVEELSADVTFEKLYIEPIVTLFHRHGGRAWKQSDAPMQLLVELKSETAPTLQAVTRLLDRYPQVFDTTQNPLAVQVTITGNVPAPTEFANYPQYIHFDGDLSINYSAEALQRIALFSADFSNFSGWNGKGSIVAAEAAKLQAAIDQAHHVGKPIRFWGAPESPTVYYTFYNMGIDYINTDYPELCAQFFSDFGNKNFQIGKRNTQAKGTTGTKRLDKTTRDFSGFQNDKLQLSQPIEIYQPTFKSDGKKGRIKNVIFLIGDGMGLAQIVAAAYANHGLTTLQLKNMGLQQNNAADAFTTDSAAAGSALATGEQHNNRHISATPEGKPIASLSDYFYDKGCAVGVVTLGNVADATPSAFYGHDTERDHSDQLTASLLDGKLDLLCGSGIRQFEERNDRSNFIEELSKEYHFIRSSDEIPAQTGKVICIDERMDEAAEEANLGLLAEVTRASIEHLKAQNDNGFFLMIEGAKIDYAGHSKCLPGSILEMLSFDMAVAEALKFADSDSQTLVIITADHETGGLTLLDGDLQSGRIMGCYVSDDHTPIMLPVFAYGPQSQTFCGCYMNTEIARKIRSLYR